MRIFFDIETSPNVGYFWKAGYKLNVPEMNIVRERAVICVCWKREGSRQVHSLAWNNGNDKTLLRKFIAAVSDADELVAHNGLHFDMPWLRGRCLKHGLVFPDVPCLDTCAQSRRLFALNSNALDYLSRYLGVGRKISTDFALWVRCMNGDAAAVAEMQKYCRHDVTILERVFQRLQPHLSAASHRGVSAGHNRLSCPVCGSSSTVKHRYRVTAAGLGRVQMRCKDCGKFFILPETTYARLINV